MADSKKRRKTDRELASPTDEHSQAYVRAVLEVAKLTDRVRKAEADLAVLQAERKAAMRRASELGVTFYALAKAADTSPSSATRMVNEQPKRPADS